ncbi:MAG TPA: protease pro-enzyme activation domain-containing protein [Candidatus Elarobacter sp.]|jgi:subtilase family serine protease|nr:protease pro-enzyme activation domain-containing protein [Candidatus Elarobacter sp.]
MAALGAAAILSACGGGGGSSHAVPLAPSNPVGSSSSLQSTTFKYTQGGLKGATVSGPAQLGTIKVDVQMQLKNPTGLQQYAKSVGDPTSGLYRHFLTPEQIATQFGANTSDWNAAIAYFTAQGLAVTGWKQQTALRVVGTQAQMEKAFGTKFVWFKGPTGTILGPATTPRFSTPLAVHSVSQLVFNPAWTKRNFMAVPPHGVPPPFDFGIPSQQLAAAFDYAGAYAAGFTGNGVNIGVIGTGPISAADYNAYKQYLKSGWLDASGAFHPTTNTITQVDVQPTANVNGGTPATPPPVTGPCNGPLPACNPEDGEAQIDTQQTASLAPTANVLFYLGYVPAETFGTGNNYGPQEGIAEVNDEVQQAINDNTADVLSLSYGIAEEYSDYTQADGTTYDPNGLEPTQFAMLQSEGISVFVSSGDAGAEGCSRPYYGVAPGVAGPDQPCVSAPAVDQNVTSVGGITAPIDVNGKQIGPYTTWGVQTEHGYGATGGGLSVAVPIPAYQTGPGITGSKRNQPDMALDGDPDTGVAIAVNIAYGGGFGGIGGTSVAAPEAAAMWALVVDACHQTAACTAKGSGPHPYRLGNAAPYMYNIYNSATLYPATFLDIVDGNNGVIPCAINPGQVGPCPNPSPTPGPGFNAGKGYDLTTGIGVPFARHLIRSVVGI